MTPAKRIISVLTAIAAIAVLALWLSTRSQSRTAAAASPQPLPADPLRPPETTRAQPSPLPPADASATQIYDLLRARADAGDGVAACRLAVTLIDCRQVRALVAGRYQAEDDPETAFEREGNLEAANHMAQRELSMRLAWQRCEGLGDDRIAQAGNYLRRAAQAGINEALVRYADGQGFAAKTPFAAMQEPIFDLWRREALPAAQRALRQGEPSAAVLLYIAYSDDSSPFAGLVADDPVRAQTYRALMSRLRGTAAAEAAGLTAEQNAQARALAARIHREDFAGAALPPGTRLGASLYSDWQVADEHPRERCR